MDGIVFDVLYNGQPLPIQLSLQGTLLELKEMLMNFTGVPIKEQVLINLADNVKDDTVLSSVDLNGLELLHIPEVEQPLNINNNIVEQINSPIIPPQNNNIVGQHPPLNFHEDDDDDDNDDIQEFNQLNVQGGGGNIYQTSRFATNFFPDVQTESGQISVHSLMEFVDQLNYPDFANDLLANYTIVVPKPFQGTFKEAMQEARRTGKLVMAYLFSENEISMHFCLEILRSEEVFQLISENFIFWVANITPEAEPLFFSLIQFESYPIVTLVGSFGAPQIISVQQGIQSRSDFYNKLITDIETNQPQLERIKAEEEESHQARMIVEEQDLAYQESLKADKEKQERQEQEKLQQESKTQEKLNRGKLVPPEPPKSKDSTHIIFKLPSDEKLERRFNSTDTLQTLVNFLDGEGCEIDNYQFASQYPRKIFKKDSFNQTLSEAGLAPQAILNVRDEDS